MADDDDDWRNPENPSDWRETDWYVETPLEQEGQAAPRPARPVQQALPQPFVEVTEQDLREWEQQHHPAEVRDRREEDRIVAEWDRQQEARR